MAILVPEGQGCLLALSPPWMVTVLWQVKALGTPTMDVCPCFQDTHLCVIGTSFIYTGFGGGGGEGLKQLFCVKPPTFLSSVSGTWVLSRKVTGSHKGP